MKRVYTAIENDDDKCVQAIELIIIGARETSTADASFNGRVPIFIDKDKFPIRPTKCLFLFNCAADVLYIDTLFKRAHVLRHVKCLVSITHTHVLKAHWVPDRTWSDFVSAWSNYY